MRKVLFRFTICIFCVQFAAVLPQAEATIMWGNQSGSADYFDWINGQSIHGLFGDPQLVGGNTFLFFPSNFRAESSNGVPDTVSDRLEFELVAHSGYNFSGINITEYGDYGVFGTGYVQAHGNLSVENMITSEALSDILVSNPVSPIISGQGDFSAEASIAINSPSWTHLRVILENNMIAISSPGSTSFIEKKILGNAIALEIVPEPASIAILSMGTLLLFRFRKK